MPNSCAWTIHNITWRTSDSSRARVCVSLSNLLLICACSFLPLATCESNSARVCWRASSCLACKENVEKLKKCWRFVYITLHNEHYAHCDWSLPMIYQSIDEQLTSYKNCFPCFVQHGAQFWNFENDFEISPDRASEGLKKSLVGAVYEQEKEETKTKSVPGDLKKYLKWNNLRTVVCLRGKFVIFLILLFCSLYKTNRCHFAVCLFSYRSQKTSKCGKNTNDTLACGSCTIFLFLPHFAVIFDL